MGTCLFSRVLFIPVHCIFHCIALFSISPPHFRLHLYYTLIHYGLPHRSSG
jgi:hypothetical protein